MWAWLLLAAAAAWLYWEFWGKRRGLPPGPPPLPILGNIAQIDPPRLESILTEWRRRYGDTFTVWIGDTPNVLVCGAGAMRQLFTSAKTADAFAGRPDLITFTAFHGKANTGVVFSWGEQWRETRRFSMHVLRDFGVGKSIIEDSIREEGEAMLAYFTELMNDQPSANLDPMDPLTICVINVISRIVFGHAYKRSDARMGKLRDHISAMLEVMGTTPAIMLAAMPWLRHVPILDHFGYDTIRNTSMKFFEFIDRECDDIRSNYDARDEPACFVEAYAREMEERKAAGKEAGPFEPFQLSRTVGDFWSAGFETTLTTLRWAIVFMAHNPEAQAKVHAELDAFYGDEIQRAVSMEDKLSLPYTQGAINEVQRLANIVPLNLQHKTTREVEVSGYRLPKDTVVVPSIGSVLTDERVFAQPEAFKPERFSQDGKVVKVEELLPFGLGKRMCAGESLARTELFILFTMLARRFAFEVSPSHGLPSLEPIIGQVRKPKPFTVTFVNRHPRS